ncbi:MAG: hypothetical protein WC551_12550 [Patescibacteria group bacterium]
MNREGIRSEEIMVELAKRANTRRNESLVEARKLDETLAQSRNARIPGSSGMLKRQYSVTATMNAVDAEGRKVLSRDADNYWKDQDKMYFGIDERAQRSVKSMRNRHGRVSFRKIYK